MNIHRAIATSLFLAAFVLVSGWALLDEPMRYTLQPESQLWIEGTSTLHDWTCEVQEVTGAIDADAAPMTIPYISHVEVSVPVNAIECNNGTMNKKSRKALKASEYPVIQYVLDEATVLSGAGEDVFELATTGRLTMAGTERVIEMAVEGTALADGSFRFTGNTPLLMTDFGVKPPTALLGTLKTGDRVVVRFDVVVAPTSPS